MEEMEECVEKHGYTYDEIVNKTLVYRNDEDFNLSLPVKARVTPSLTIDLMGVCYKLVFNKTFLTKDSLLIGFGNISNSYRVYLHDENFFMLKSNNYVVPFIELKKPLGESYTFVTSYNSRMNRLSTFHCNTDKNYNFNKCVSNNIANKIGCELPWPPTSSMSSMKNCNTTSKFQAYLQTYIELYGANHDEMEELTGCQLPCHYHHYSIVGTPSEYEMPNGVYITLTYASTDVTESEEVWLYPFDSLVSEFGGALGLFLGFSFLGIFDIVKFCIKSVTDKVNQKHLSVSTEDSSEV